MQDNNMITTTYTFWNTYRNCPRACSWRYLHELVPHSRSINLRFGSLIHECLEHWHQHQDIAAVQELIDRTCIQRTHDLDVKQAWHLASAMMMGYVMRYPDEKFTVIDVERVFSGIITNPVSGKPSRTFMLAGKIDGLVEIDGETFLLEHKTTGCLDSSYLEKLWMDFQLQLYAHALEMYEGIKVAGAIYNILVKSRLRQGQGETEMEFQQRAAELSAKNKSGKSTATRKLPEADRDFQARLRAKYVEPEMFHREVLYFSRDQMHEVASELWLLTQQFLEARKNGWFIRNTAYCFNYGTPCAYYPLCRANGAQHVIDNLYEHRQPHEELFATNDDADTTPVF
jgi:hypothetical protein